MTLRWQIVGLCALAISFASDSPSTIASPGGDPRAVLATITESSSTTDCSDPASEASDQSDHIALPGLLAEDLRFVPSHAFFFWVELGNWCITRGIVECPEDSCPGCGGVRCAKDHKLHSLLTS